MNQLVWAIGLVCGLVSWLGLFPARRWLGRSRIVDVPNERSSHSRPTPRGGGLVIVLVTLVGVATYGIFANHQVAWVLLAYGASAALVAAISWADDLWSLPSSVRLAVHVLAGALLIAAIGPWPIGDIPLLGDIPLGWVGVPVTLLWVVGLTNAYNFMDGIDGIAAGQAVVAGVGWAILGACSNQPDIRLIGLVLAAASAGFLLHNWPPARIFMGDVGSAFLGYSFAALPVIAARHDARLALPGALLVWPFLFDTTVTFLRRLCRGDNVFAAHRSHLYQRLVIAGLSHRAVTLLYTMLAMAGALLALSWWSRVPGSPAASAIVLPLASATLWSFVRYRELELSPCTKA